MDLKKLIAYVLVFVLGFAACALILKTQYGSPTMGGIASSPAPSSLSPIAAGDKNPVALAAAIAEQYVVNIDTVGRPQVSGGFGGLFSFGEPQEVVPKGQASGVIIRPDGYILTNNHVVADANKVTVRLHNKDGKEKSYPARLVGRDPKTDLAVIKIDATGLAAAAPANSDRLEVGDWVIAVGNPLGLGTTVTVGVVSATVRENLQIEGTVLEKAIQTDASINRGNSGGALSDLSGRLVGINTAIASAGPGGGSIGIGFAIPSNTAMKIANELISKGKVVRPWIGIMYLQVNDDVRRELGANGQVNLPKVDGALIREVVPNSPADRAGLMPLDVITQINGKKVTSSSVISEFVKMAKVGQIVDLTVWHARTNQTVKVSLRLDEMPAAANP